MRSLSGFYELMRTAAGGVTSFLRDQLNTEVAAVLGLSPLKPVWMESYLYASLLWEHFNYTDFHDALHE